MRTETLHIRVSPDEKRALDAAAAAARMPLARYLHRLVTMNLALDSELAALRQAVESAKPASPESPDDLRKLVKSEIGNGLADILRAVESAAAIRLKDVQADINAARAEIRGIDNSVASMLAEEVVALRRSIDEAGIPRVKSQDSAALLELLFMFRAISKRERVVNAQAELALLGIEPAHSDIAVAPKPAAESEPVPEPVPEPEKKRKFGIF